MNAIKHPLRTKIHIQSTLKEIENKFRPILLLCLIVSVWLYILFPWYQVEFFEYEIIPELDITNRKSLSAITFRTTWALLFGSWFWLMLYRILGRRAYYRNKRKVRLVLVWITFKLINEAIEFINWLLSAILFIMRNLANISVVLWGIYVLLVIGIITKKVIDKQRS